MFKIIFNHLSSQTINKPSISNKFNRWGLSKTELNINRFENILFFYKKELLNSKYNSKKIINYNYISIIEGFFFLIFTIIIFFLSFYFLLIFYKLIKTKTLIFSLKFSLYYIFLNQFTFFIILLLIIYYFFYTFLLQNKQFILWRFF